GLLGFALVTQPLQLGLVRLMEGYWGTGRAAASLAARARTRHLRLREELVRLQLTTAADSARERSSRAQRNYAIWSLARRYPPEPRTLEEERALNEELSTFLLEPFAGHQLTYAVDDDAATAESPPPGSLGSGEDRSP